ncbi:HTH-type transcriptional repressor RspR [Austwickia sp. TVS 96-490-7B]|uniref:GntR family transcriptional regulator n=1 Tax=Austwickia sp. TVS 96-490-7B TaxID=2830843 RepID=UPI001C586367|nr:GntR family transcriptional regulator [Austwickia sp. TVS 96-490-7B]MBW3086270.1 HTH-type transcriptional repressor RspR [Austwickia sp. TVS 96-490-7B]
MSEHAPALPRLSPGENLRDAARQALEAALVSGRLQPGLVYSVPSLAEGLGVSATPVREAMLDLASDGLVVSVRNKGFRVCEPTPHQLDDLVATRALLEIPTVVTLSLTLDAGRVRRIEALRPVARRIVEAAGRDDLVAYVEADTRFHLGLLAEAGNDALVDVVRRLRARSRLLGLAAMAQDGQLLRQAREHEELLDVVLSGDGAATESAMRKHLRDVRGESADDRRLGVAVPGQ